MKILLLAHYGEDYYSYRRSFLNFLKAYNHECLGMVPIDNYQDRILKDSSHKVYFYKYKRDWRFIFYIYSLYIKLKLVHNKEHIDIIFTYKFFPNLVGILCARIIGIKEVVATVAGMGFLEKQNTSAFIFVIAKIYFKILNLSDYVIVQNKEDINFLQSYLTKPKLVLTHGSGVDINKFNIKKNFDYKIDLDYSIKYIVFCSRIVKEKGIIELIKAFKQVSIDEDCFNYHLVIAGWFDNKNIEKETLLLIKNDSRIHFVGYQANVMPLLSLATIVVLPSYYPEGVPRALTEALAMRKPIITTNNKGCKETCIDGKNGFIVQPKSVESLYIALKKLVAATDEEIELMGNNSFKLFEEKFEQSVVFNKIINELELN